MTPYYADDLVALYHGDSREIVEWQSADVLVTDPPYGIDYRTNTGGQFTGRPIAGDRTEEMRDEVMNLWGERPAAVFASHKQRPLGAPNPLPLVWDKGDAVGMGNLSWPWRPNYELVWVYGAGWSGRRTSAVLRHRSLPGNFSVRHHPTEKPVGLLEEILAKAPPGVIADPFAGSGSTLLAARNLGRRAVGVELDERYCETIAARLSQAALPIGA